MFEPLSAIYLPKNAVDEFLCYVSTNTDAEKESLGILMGKEIDGINTITTIFLPPQTISTDSCAPLEESHELRVQYTESSHLIELGWIHTHPIQDQFMSSPDMHTTFNYQIQNKSSISIVVSAQEPNIQYYRLTATGMAELKKCERPGENFCNHPRSWYEVATHVVFIDEDESFEIADWRYGEPPPPLPASATKTPPVTPSKNQNKEKKKSKRTTAKKTKSKRKNKSHHKTIDTSTKEEAFNTYKIDNPYNAKHFKLFPNNQLKCVTCPKNQNFGKVSSSDMKH